MITNITLENFKCFRHISVDPKLVTVFIGPNGTGKSGVMQALLLLKQSRHDVRQLKLNGELILFPLEAFMLHGHESSLDNVRISLSAYSPIVSEEVQGPLKFEVDLQYSGQASLKVDSGSTKWLSSDRQYVISFDRKLHPPQAATPRGAIGYEVLPQINSFDVTVGMGGEDRSLPLWQKVSQIPEETLSNLKMVPAARGLVRGRLHVRIGFFRRHFRCHWPRHTGGQHSNDPGLFPPSSGEGFPSNETDYRSRF